MSEQKVYTPGRRRLAANRVRIDGNEISLCVVEIEHGEIVDYYAFSEELPFTEWIGGLIEAERDKDGKLTSIRHNGSAI